MPNLGNLTGAELNSFVGRLTTNEANIAQNQVLISQLNSSSTANLSSIQTNLQADISSNTTAIGTNATDIATNATAITTINTALSGKASKAIQELHALVLEQRQQILDLSAQVASLT